MVDCQQLLQSHRRIVHKYMKLFDKISRKRSATIVFVHASWYGGWCWSRTRPMQEEVGARAGTPTLTTLGASASDKQARQSGKPCRRHRQPHRPRGLNGVVLVATAPPASPPRQRPQGGLDAVSHLVLLDAFFPMEGETLVDYLGSDFANDFNARQPPTFHGTSRPCRRKRSASRVRTQNGSTGA